jgi:uncharacterized protein with HEPN domain
MSHSDDWVRLRHILDASRLALDATGSREAEDIDGDQITKLALERLIGIIGEAASRLSPQMTARMPSIPWKGIVGMRNIVVHAYFDVDVPRVLRTVRSDLPALIRELERVLREDGHLD